jgi:hypothetical protein
MTPDRYRYFRAANLQAAREAREQLRWFAQPLSDPMMGFAIAPLHKRLKAARAILAEIRRDYYR